MFLLLDLVKKFCFEINQTNETKEKIKILKLFADSNESLRKLLKYVYDSSINFNVTSKNIQKFKKNKYKEKNINYNFNIFFLLDQLYYAHWTGNEALENICHFIESFCDYESIIYNIIDKNLKIGISKTTLQKIYPQDFPSFYVSLANNYNEKFIEDDNWYVSRKLDGVRCLCVIENGQVNIFSRNQKKFKTLSLLQREIEEKLLHKLENGVLDGEIIDNFEKDSFKAIMEQITRKNYTLENFEFRVFDYIPLQDFQNGKSNLIFSERMGILETILSEPNLRFCKILTQQKFSKQSFKDLVEESQEKNWEGVMLRKNTHWSGKRSNDLLKYKLFFDDEFEVIDMEFGPFQIIDSKTNLQTEIQCLSSVTIDYNNTKVGSGFSIEERIKFYENPELIKNKKITVKFFQKTENNSLRFPVFKSIFYS